MPRAIIVPNATPAVTPLVAPSPIGNVRPVTPTLGPAPGPFKAFLARITPRINAVPAPTRVSHTFSAPQGSPWDFSPFV